LDPRWVGAFFALPESEEDGAGTWTPDFFRLRHFVSMYLPLRYWAWTRSSGRRNRETELLLETLVVGTVETLWRGITAPGSPDSELVGLVLGAENPLRLVGGERIAWEGRYTAVVKEMSHTWRARESWPRREAMALHVASFYLPLGLPPGPVQGSVDSPQKRLLDGLASYVDPDVAELVGLWLSVAAAPRDDAGVPVVAWSTAARRLAGRTETEILLLG
jgi:hypothetical protein